MSNRDVIVALARVVIAVAWADGKVTHEEENSLKSFLLQLRSTGFARGIELTGREWARLDMYLVNPVNAAERARLVVELQEAVHTREQKQLAVQALRDVIAADGEVTAEERAVLADIEAALEDTSVGVSGLLQRMIGTRLRTRKEAIAHAPDREQFFNDFLRNRVYYALARHLPDHDVTLELSEAEQRKLGLAGALLARVAHVDGRLTDAEFQALCGTIQAHWSLGETEAAFVAEVALESIDDAVDITYIRHELARTATVDERRQILTALFALAAADGEISQVEHEEIRQMARGLNLAHPDFIDAKLRALGKA